MNSERVTDTSQAPLDNEMARTGELRKRAAAIFPEINHHEINIMPKAQVQALLATKDVQCEKRVQGPKRCSK